jgi:hypothetical protein
MQENTLCVYLDNPTHKELEEAVDYRDYSNGSLFDLQNGPSSGAPFWFTKDTFAVIDAIGEIAGDSGNSILPLSDTLLASII